MAIVPLVAAFSGQYPNIVVDLALGDEVVDILSGEADVAVRFGHLPDGPLTARRIGETGQVVVASPDYLRRHGIPLKPDDLLNHNCLRFNFRRAEPNWPFRYDDETLFLKIGGNIECSSGEVLAQLAKAGARIARIGQFTVAEDI
jgi:DNA-binding transcriptional LysR family regulator